MMVWLGSQYDAAKKGSVISKLGDVFRFLIAHQERHFTQIDRILTEK
jgi:hypothetical protein